MTKTDFSKLKRPLEPMPGFVQDALEESSLLNAYRSRPAYQQNDYLLWINTAKRDKTKMKRLNQMLLELEAGDTYMNMPYKPKNT